MPSCQKKRKEKLRRMITYRIQSTEMNTDKHSRELLFNVNKYTYAHNV